VVLVHGTSATAARWSPVLPALEKHCRVAAVSQRGRSESGDAGQQHIAIDTAPDLFTREVLAFLGEPG
jgi:pimeloyl-ACP methyl ester carboxylesterase